MTSNTYPAARRMLSPFPFLHEPVQIPLREISDDSSPQFIHSVTLRSQLRATLGKKSTQLVIVRLELDEVLLYDRGKPSIGNLRLMSIKDSEGFLKINIQSICKEGDYLCAIGGASNWRGGEIRYSGLNIFVKCIVVILDGEECTSSAAPAVDIRGKLIDICVNLGKVSLGLWRKPSDQCGRYDTDGENDVLERYHVYG